MTKPDQNNANVIKSSQQFKHDSFEYFSKELASENIKKIYRGDEILKAEKEGYFHFNDKSAYISQPHNCYNLDLRSIEKNGLDIKFGCKAEPPSKLDSFLNQTIEYMALVTSEISGGICLPFFNLFIQNFWDIDNAKYNEQCLQSFIFRLNQLNGSRSGAMFSSINLYLNTDHFNQKFNENFSKEKSDDIVNKLCGILLEGDANENPFLFPNVVFNITDTNLIEYPKIFDLTSKFFTPYFLIDREDFEDDKAITVALGCRTQLHTNWTGELSDILNVGNAVYNTLNLPQIALKSIKEKTSFLSELRYYMGLLRILTKARINQIEFVQSNEYMHYITNFFDYQIENQTFVIGLLGLEEASEILFGKPLSENIDKMKEYVQKMREIIDTYKKEDELRWALFSSPAENAQGKLAKKCIRWFGFKEAKVKGSYDTPYYSNGINIDSGADISFIDQIKLEDELSLLCNGGNLNNIHLGSHIDSETCCNLIQKIHDQTNLPFISLTGVYSICQDCGSKAQGEIPSCVNCDSDEMICYSRVTGYYRPTITFNKSRYNEYQNRSMKIE